MDFQRTQKERDTYVKRTVVLGFLLSVSLISTTVLALCVINASRVILIPTLPSDASLDIHGQVDATYLEALTRDASWLFLNKTPETARYFEQKAKRIMDPVSFQAVRVEFEKQSAKAETSHTSQAFFPDDFFVDPASLYSEVRGRLVIMQGTGIIDDQLKVYALQWRKTGTLIRLTSIAEIDPKDAKGDQVKPTTGGQ